MALPSFICTGFQKSGTTTLYAVLKQHPGVELCRDVKEPMYYRVPALRFFGGKLFYEKRYFGHIKPGDTHMLGEINAGLNFSGCAKKIAKDFPADTKLVFMMRNPVARSYSAYKYFLARGFLPKKVVQYDIDMGHSESFERYVHEVLDDPAQRSQIMNKRMKYLVFSQSNYATCIEEYLERFDRENMKFVFFEEFVSDQHSACRDLYGFLGLEDCDGIDYDLHENGINERAVEAGRPKQVQVAKGFRYGFYEFLAMSHWAPGLMRAYSKFYEHLRGKSMCEDTDRGKVLPQTRDFLQEYYEPQVRELEKIVGRDLSGLWF